MALGLVVIMGFAALGFDLAYVRLGRLQMQNASDAAAHAAMVTMRLTNRDQAAARSEAITIAGAHKVLGNPVQLADSDVVFGSWDYSGQVFSAGGALVNAVSVNGRRADTTAADGNVSLSFGRVLGFQEASVARSSVGAFRSRYTMFEVDVTGSLLEGVGALAPDGSCALDQAVNADLQFIDALDGAGVAADRIGLDIFTGGTLPVTPLQILSSNYASIRALWKGSYPTSTSTTSHTLGIGACTRGALLPTGTYSPCANGPAKQWPNQANVGGGVPNIDCAAGDFNYSSQSPKVFGGTNIGAGIKSGRDRLNAVAKTGEIRSIVVFTDGGPMCCEKASGGGNCGPGGGWPNPCCADGTDPACSDNIGGAACKCSQDVSKYGQDQADAAYADGIDVYVLAFGNRPRWIDYAKTLPRGRGFEVDTADATKLAASLLQIANSIPIALVK